MKLFSPLRPTSLFFRTFFKTLSSSYLQCANATVTPDNVDSTWSCLSFLVAYQVEFVSVVGMRRQGGIVIIAEKAFIEIHRSPSHTEKHAKVSEFDDEL